MARINEGGTGTPAPKPPRPPKPKTPAAPPRGKGDNSRGRDLIEAKHAGTKDSVSAGKTTKAVRRMQAARQVLGGRKPSLLSASDEPLTYEELYAAATPDERRRMGRPVSGKWRVPEVLPKERAAAVKSIKDTGDPRGVEVSPNVFMPRHPAGWPYMEVSPGVFEARDPRGTWQETKPPIVSRQFRRPAGPYQLPKGMVSPYSAKALPPLLDRKSGDPLVSDWDLLQQAQRNLDAVRVPPLNGSQGWLQDVLGIRVGWGEHAGYQVPVQITYGGPLSSLNPIETGVVEGLNAIVGAYQQNWNQTQADRWFKQREDEQKGQKALDKAKDDYYDWFPTFPEKETDDYKWMSNRDKAADDGYKVAKKSSSYHGQGRIGSVERQLFYLGTSGDFSPWGLNQIYNTLITEDSSVGPGKQALMSYDPSLHKVNIPIGGFGLYGPVNSDDYLRHEMGHHFDDSLGWMSLTDGYGAASGDVRDGTNDIQIIEGYAEMNRYSHNYVGDGFSQYFPQFTPQAWDTTSYGNEPSGSGSGPAYVPPEPGPRSNTSSRPSEDPTESRWLERWVTHHANTCPRCAALNGRVFWNDEGPTPGLHDHCGCERVRA